MRLVDIFVPEGIGQAEEYVVVTWLKRVGDPVQEGELLLVVQVEKVAYDVPSPISGTLAEILVQQGEVARRDQPLARIAVEEEAPAPPPGEGEVLASPLAKRLAKEHNIDLRQVKGTGRDGRITERDVRRYLEQQRAPAEKPSTAPVKEEVRASPAANRLAREHNVDLRQVKGTGRDGRITERDVLAYLEARQAAGQTIPFAGMRATIARRMHESLQTMAQVTLHTEADVTALVELREQYAAEHDVTYTDFIVRACALALRAHPRLNAVLEEDHIRLLPFVHIGIAVALDDGLVVPVIRDADQKGIFALAAARRELVERARTGRLTAEEMSGGTFTVTNLGPYEIDGFTPIINPPEAAILGVGRIVEKVVVYQGKVAQRSMMTLSLTFDHRVVDGAPAAAFLQAVKRHLEEPDVLVQEPQASDSSS